MNKTSNSIPKWFQDCWDSYVASESHCFAIYGDIDGYAYGTLPHRRFLSATFSQEGQNRIVMLYNLAQGIHFANENMREEAIKLLPDSQDEADIDPISQALAGIGESDSGPRDPFSTKKPLEAFQIMEQILRSDGGKKKVAVIVDYTDKIMPPQNKGSMSQEDRTLLVLLQNWGLDHSLGNNSNPIFFLIRDIEDLHPDLRGRSSGYKAIEIPLPVYDDRRQFLEYFRGLREEKNKPIKLVDITVPTLARLTAGLNLKNLEDLLLLAFKAGGVTTDLVKKYKDGVIENEYGGIIEIIDPLAGGFGSVAGMDETITWLKEELIAPLREGRLEDIPKGILFAGPPGGGKTWLVRAIADEADLNALELNIENILGGIVGTSERNLKKAFQLARELSPVVFFIDEFDQMTGSKRSAGSGDPVGGNLFSALLRFMSDPSLRGKVIFIFATNRPDLIDPAILRPGRTDWTIPIRLADDAGRRAIVCTQARLQGFRIEEDAASYIAEHTELYSSADLEAVVSEARKRAKRNKGTTITLKEAEFAVGDIRSESAELAEYYTVLAIKSCRNLRLLTAQERDMVKDPAGFKKKVQQAKSSVPKNMSKFDQDEREERE
jgi:DNA polymerase III delta prime subunit